MWLILVGIAVGMVGVVWLVSAGVGFGALGWVGVVWWVWVLILWLWYGGFDECSSVVCLVLCSIGLL